MSNNQIERAARLRAQVEALEREDRERGRRPGWPRRVLGWFPRIVTAVLVAVLVADGYLAYRAFTDDVSPTGAGWRTDESAPDFAWADLVVEADPDSSFGGTIRVRSDVDRDMSVGVQVDLFEGDQHVGTVAGDVVLKPRSVGELELESADAWTDYTEARVHLSPWFR